MKKIIALSLVMAFAAATANAGAWSRLQGFAMETKKPEAEYALDVAGENVRIYEFTPKTNNNVTCVMAFGKKTADMQCFKKESK